MDLIITSGEGSEHVFRWSGDAWETTATLTSGDFPPFLLAPEVELRAHEVEPWEAEVEADGTTIMFLS